MTTRMDSMVAKGMARIAHFAGQSVQYHRGNASVVLAAVRSTANYELASEGEVSETFASNDFLIMRSELVLDGLPITPQNGDTIRIIKGDAAGVYEIRDRNGLPCFDWSDPDQTRYRIHTKQLADEVTA